MASTSGVAAFQSRLHTLLILRAIAQLQKTVIIWAFVSLAILSFIAMVATAAKTHPREAGVQVQNAYTQKESPKSVNNRQNQVGNNPSQFNP